MSRRASESVPPPASDSGRLERHESFATEPRRYTTEQLFDGKDEVEILHREVRYRLRQTSQGKLILTK